MSVHIGKIIEQKFQESGIKLPAFADKINTGERNVYSIFKRKDINASMLKEISAVLEYNFFQLYENELALKEPIEIYKVKERPYNSTIPLSLPFKDIDQLPKFLKEVNETAARYGFTIG